MKILKQLFAWYAQGKLKPLTSKTYTLNEAALALNDHKKPEGHRQTHNSNFVLIFDWDLQAK